MHSNKVTQLSQIGLKSIFYGLTIDWKYACGYVDMSMQNQICKGLERFQHQFFARNKFSPHEHTPHIFSPNNMPKLTMTQRVWILRA